MASTIFLVFRALSWLVIAKVILSYFMSPNHPVREAIDRIVDPMLEPIRKIIPTTGAFDFSPLLLILLLQFLGQILANLFSTI